MSHIPPIQEAADDLARRLKRSVEVDSPSLHVICASAQHGPIDQSRISSIINRTPPLEPVPWMLGFGIQESTAPVRIPPNDEYGMLGRICIPLRHGGRLVGHLWLIDSPPLTDPEIDVAVAAASSIAELVQRSDSALPNVAEQRGEVARLILSGDEPSLADARQRDWLPGDGALTVRKVLVEAPPEAIRRFGEELARPTFHRPYLVHPEFSSVTLIESPRTAEDTDLVTADLLHAARACDVDITAWGTARAVDGVSAAAALARARFVAEVAKLSGVESLAWGEAGAWRLLFGWELRPETVRAVSPHAAALLDAPTNSYWRTLLTYLDLGRNVTEAAAACFIHRATLHYRLDRAREIMGEATLDDGWETAALHVALKLHGVLESRSER